MKLKEGFRLQSHLLGLEKEALVMLCDNSLYFNTTTEHQCNKCDSTKADWVEENNVEEDINVDTLVKFLSYIIEERDELSEAIYNAKKAYGEDIDSKVSVNSDRHNIYKVLMEVLDWRPKKNKRISQLGYKFNDAGEQVTYRYDGIVTQIEAYDRQALKEFANKLIEKADKVSSEIDEARVNINIDFESVITPNDSLYDAIEKVVFNN